MFKKVIKKWLGIEELNNNFSKQIDDMDVFYREMILSLEKKHWTYIDGITNSLRFIQERESEVYGKVCKLDEKINAIHNHFGLEEKIVPASSSKVILSKKKNVEG